MGDTGVLADNGFFNRAVEEIDELMVCRQKVDLTYLVTILIEV